MLTGLPVTVVGAGIGGLAAAAALAGRGADVEVLERAPEVGEIGAGLQISPNGFAVLRALGLSGEVESAGVRAQAVQLLDHHARPVLRLDLARHAPDARYLFLHRADLIDILRNAAQAAGARVRPGTEVSEAQDGADAARLTLADGGTRNTPLVIGADGLQSVLRPVLNGPAEPVFTGQAAWRALVPADRDEPSQVRVYMGPGRHLVRYPLRGGSLVNLVAVEERSQWTAEGWRQRDEPHAVQAAFAGFSPGVRDLLARVERVHVWGLFRHPVARRWHGERIALLGDAAHPTLPFLAQGANLALEDAWVLADCLAAQPLPDALPLYQARRRDRAARVIAASTANARNYHLRNPLIRAAAHAALRLGGALAPAAPLRRFHWLYGHDVTA